MKFPARFAAYCEIWTNIAADMLEKIAHALLGRREDDHHGEE